LIIQDPLKFEGSTYAEIYLQAQNDCGKYSKKSQSFVICDNVEMKFDVMEAKVQEGQDMMFLTNEVHDYLEVGFYAET
jgi:hypothetical protein